MGVYEEGGGFLTKITCSLLSYLLLYLVYINLL